MQLTWLLWACSTPTWPTSTPVEPTESPSEPAPHSAGDTGATTAPTTPLEPIGIEPSVRIIGPPGLMFSDGVAAMEATRSQGSLLAININVDTEVAPELAYRAPGWYGPYPDAIFLHGEVPRGVHTLAELWDGVSGTTFGVPDWTHHTSSDVNGDDIEDFWLGLGLFTGPLFGRVQTRDDAIVTPSPRDGSVVLAGFDADRDGHDDILTRAGTQQLVLRYGPFAPGPLPSFADGEVPDDQVTVFGVRACGVDFAVTRIPDLLGPGRDVVAHGGSSSCPYNYVMYELLQPRGRQLLDPVAKFEADPEDQWFFTSIGDVDGDAKVDFLATMAWGSAGIVLPGPPSLTYDLDPWFDLEDSKALIQVPPRPISDIRWTVGDLNGDGTEELLGVATPENDDSLTRWALSFSPHADPIAIADALAVSRLRLKIELGELHADLDGDGLQDLVSTIVHPKSRDADLYPNGFPDPDLVDTSEIVIWYGADLLAAENARRADLGLEPFPVRTR